MLLGNTTNRYGLVAQSLHWAVAVLILILFGLGLFMQTLNVDTPEQIAFTFSVFSLHKTLGLTVFSLAILRIIWAVAQPHPHALSTHKPAEVLAAQVVHWLLYVAILVMPLTGFLHHSATEGLAPIWGPFPQRLGLVPQTQAAEVFWGWAHYLTAWVMGSVIALHILGALKHAVLDRDGTVRRMIPGMGQIEVSTSMSPFKSLGPVLAALAVVATGTAITLTSPSQEQPPSEVAAPTDAFQGNWSVVTESSTLSIEIIQSNNPVQGKFGSWSATILFDPEAPEAAQVVVDIDIASLVLGSISQQALSGDYLNAEIFPSARFTSSGFTDLGDDKYETTGMLDLAGVKKPLVLTFTLTLQEDTAQVDGVATILRLDHGVGPEASGTVGHDVQLNFVLNARREVPR